MIALALWFFKIKAIIGEISAFIIARWRIFLPLLIVGYCLFCWHNAVNRANKAEFELLQYKANAQRIADAQRLQNQLKKIEGENNAKAIALKQKQALEKIGLANVDRANLQNKLRAYQNETLHLTNRINDTNRNWSERVRIESSRSISGLPKEPEDKCDTAHTGIGCHAATDSKLIAYYETLKQACQITTIDLLACLEVVENDTKAVGRYD